MSTYLWNARLAKSFLYPLQMVEICIRNAMHDAFTQQYRSPNWIFKPSFEMTMESQASLATAHQRLARRKPTPSADDLVAGLSFDFWSNLFRDDYELVWLTPGLLSSTFPRLPENVGSPRIKHLVSRINFLRNRIAHHEPIHQMKVLEYLADIGELLSYLCADTFKWVEANVTVKQALYSKPVSGSNFTGTPLTLSKFRPPKIIPPTASMMEAIQAVDVGRPRAALIEDPEKHPPYALLTSAMIGSYIQEKASQLEGMIDLNAHTAADVLACTTDEAQLAAIDIRMTIGDLKAIFFPKVKKADKATAPRPPAAVLIMNPAKQAAPIGLALRPEVKL